MRFSMKKTLAVITGCALGLGIEAVVATWYRELQHPQTIDILYNTLNDLRMSAVMLTVIGFVFIFSQYHEYSKIRQNRIKLESEIMLD